MANGTEPTEIQFCLSNNNLSICRDNRIFIPLQLATASRILMSGKLQICRIECLALASVIEISFSTRNTPLVPSRVDVEFGGAETRTKKKLSRVAYCV